MIEKRLWPRWAGLAPSAHLTVLREAVASFGPLLADDPVALVDIGAAYGLKEPFVYIEPYLRLIAFEPDPEEHRRLAEASGPRRLVLQKALYDRAAEVDFHHNRMAATSSILPANHEWLRRFPLASAYEPTHTTRLRTASLDEALNEAGVGDIDFVKLDTQGCELAVLRGGVESLRPCFGIEVEVELAPIYRDQPLFAEVDAFLRGHGFVLFDLSVNSWKRRQGLELGGPKGQVIWGDALYFRDLEGFFAATPEGATAWSIAKIVRAFTVLLLYGYLDYALELVCEAETRLPAADHGRLQQLRETLDTPHWSRYARRIPGRHRLAGLLYRIYKLLRSDVTVYSPNNYDIGNV